MFFVSLLPFLSISAIFGIDYGSEYIKVSMALPGRGIHIALNQQSKRLSPSYFAIWNISDPLNSQKNEHWNISDLDDMGWSFLDAAKSHSLRFPNNSMKGIAPVMGLRNGFSGREVLALVIRHLISTVDDGQWKAKDANLVITVEPRLPREERIAIAEAVLISNMSLTAIVDSPTAAAHVYALEKNSLFDENGKIVAFFDIGASHTWAAIYNFSNPNKTAPAVAEELSVGFNFTLGGNFMDYELSKLLMQKFYDQHKIQITNPRTKRHFLDEARRAKELLTINKQITVKIDDVVDDHGLSYLLTRKEFESLIIDFNQSLRDLFDEVVEKANLNSSQVDSIELIGGCTRVPFVKHSLMSVSGMTKLNRTMNSDEVIALGAGYIGASRSSAFVIKPVKIRPFTNVNVSLWKDGNYIQELYSENSRTTDYCFVNTTVGQLGLFAIKCNNVTQISFNFTIAQNYTAEDNVTLYFYFDAISVPTIFTAIVNGTDQVRPNFSPPNYMLTIDEIKKSSLFISRMDDITAERHRLQQIKNDYESYIYSIQDKMEYDKIFIRVLSEEDVKNLTQVIESHREWLFNSEHKSATNASTYTEKLADLKRSTKDAEFRAEQLKMRAPSFMKLNQTLHNVHNAITMTWPESKPWLIEALSFTVWLEYNQTMKWYQEMREEQLKLKEYEPPIVMYQDIDQKRKHLESTFKLTDRIPKPTPTPSPTPELVKVETPLPDDQSDSANNFNSHPNKRIDATGYENDEL